MYSNKHPNERTKDIPRACTHKLYESKLEDDITEIYFSY